jgi:hypothetical protein
MNRWALLVGVALLCPLPAAAQDSAADTPAPASPASSDNIPQATGVSSNTVPPTGGRTTAATAPSAPGVSAATTSQDAAAFDRELADLRQDLEDAQRQSDQGGIDRVRQQVEDLRVRRDVAAIDRELQALRDELATVGSTGDQGRMDLINHRIVDVERRRSELLAGPSQASADGAEAATGTGAVVALDGPDVRLGFLDDQVRRLQAELLDAERAGDAERARAVTRRIDEIRQDQREVRLEGRTALLEDQRDDARRRNDLSRIRALTDEIEELRRESSSGGAPTPSVMEGRSVPDSEDRLDNRRGFTTLQGASMTPSRTFRSDETR